MTFDAEAPPPDDELALQGPDGLLFVGDAISALTPDQLTALGDFASRMFGVEMRPVHNIEEELGTKALGITAPTATQAPEPAPRTPGPDLPENPAQLGPRQRAAETKRRRTHDALMRAATDLASERGWGEISMEDIAKAAGVSASTAYNRFRDKETLLGHVYRPLFEPLAAAVDEALAQADPRTALNFYYMGLARLVRSHHSLTGALMAARLRLADGGEPTSPDDLRLLVPLAHPLTNILQEGQRQGLFRLGGYPAEDIAESHTGVLIMTVLSHRDEPVEDIAGFALNQLSIWFTNPQ